LTVDRFGSNHFTGAGLGITQDSTIVLFLRWRLLFSIRMTFFGQIWIRFESDSGLPATQSGGLNLTDRNELVVPA
jgi:hypothetical protein